MSTQKASVALFGSFTRDQLKAIAATGWTMHSTDAPAEGELYALAAKMKLKIIPHAAAWSTLDHATSNLATRANEAGEPVEYNRNGGYTRDSQLVEQCHAVIIGTGVRPNRVKFIEEQATQFGRQVRGVPAEEIAPVDMEIVNQELAALRL